MMNIEIPNGVCKMVEDSTQSLIAGIKNLSPINEPITMEEPMLITDLDKSVKKKKKEKKKGKKKKSEFDEYKDIVSEITSSSDSENEIIFDIEEYLDRKSEEEHDIESQIVGTQKGNYKNFKKDENAFKKEFAEEMTLLYNLLDETNKYNKKLEKKYDTMESSKTRGISKYSNEIATAILQGKTSKLHIIKEIVSVKKTIADLKIKVDAKNKTSSNEVNTELAASSYLQGIIKHGRHNFIDNLTKAPDNMISSDEAILAALDPMSDDLGAYDRYEDIIEDRLSNEVNRYRNSEDGDTYIKYENEGIKIQIKRNIDDGEWELVAVNKNNQQVFDYPLPNKKDLGTVKFTDDGSYASDRYGRSYKVIEVCE